MKTKLQSLICLFILMSAIIQPQNWQTQTSNVSDLLRCIVPIDQNNVWISTTGGNVLRTNNGGTNWVVKTIPKANYAAYTMYALNSSTAWVSLTNSSQLDWRIAKTTDGGSTWTEQAINANSFGDFIHFKNANTGIIIGDPVSDNPTKWIVKKTTDGGNTYTDIPSNNIPDADETFSEEGFSNNGIAVRENLFFTSRGNSAQFIPKLYKSSNYGDNWVANSIYSFAGMGGNSNSYIAFKDSLNGIAVNSMGAVTKTTDGGITWSEMVIVNPSGFYSAHYISNNTYIIGGGSSSQGIFYISVDGGISWKKQNIPDAFPDIYSIKFANNSTGWIGCRSGKIAKWIGGNITYNPGTIQVLFKINMKYQIRRGLFNPNTDMVCIRGTFNAWDVIDTLSDADNDSIFTKTVSFPYNYRNEFKFWYKRTFDNSEVWENDPNRATNFTQPSNTYEGGYFNNDIFFESLDCGSAVTLTNNQTVYGSTTTSTSSNVTRYREYTEYSNGSFTGPERIYKIVVTDTCRIIASLTNKTNDYLEVFIKSECSPYAWGSYGVSKAVHADGKPGIYYIIVDGWNGASGNYNLTVQCQPSKPKGNVVWFEDFENDADSRWFVTGQEWQIGELRTSPWRPAFGTKCAKTNLWGNYQEGQRTYLVRQQSFLIPSKSQNPRLKFWHWYSFNCSDWGQVRLRVDRGNGNYSEWFNLSQQYYGQSSSNVWTQTSLELSKFADSLIQIGFYFESNNEFNCGYFDPDVDAGWCIDNISVVTGENLFVNPMNFDTEFFGDWSQEGSWETGVPTFGPATSYSMNNCAGTVLTGNYYEGMRDYLTSPPIIIPGGATNPYLRFRHFYRFNCSDYGNVQVKEIESEVWQPLPNSIFEGVSSGWTYSSFDISQYAKKEVQIRFYFESNNEFNCGYFDPDVDAGWYIDDIVIEPVQYVVVEKPNGGEVYGGGAVKPIEWYSNQVNNVNISYSTDNGSTWLSIANNIPASPSVYQWTVPHTPTYTAKIKVTDAANGNIAGVSDSTFTIAPVIDWSAVINIRDKNANKKDLIIGAATSGSDGLDQMLGEYQLPPLPPAGVFDVRFELPVSPVIPSPTDFRNSNLNYYEWTLKLQPSTSGYPFTLSWNIGELPAGDFILKDVVNGTTVNVNMKNQNNYALSNTNINTLKIVYRKLDCFNINVANGWGLYSVPIKANNMNADAIFNQKAAPVFGFDNANGYTSQTMLTNGKGYWVNYNSGAVIQVCGTVLGSNKIPVKSGWNIIGVYSDSALVNTVTTQNTTVQTPFYAFSNGYLNSDVLYSTKGYWVKVTTDGNLILPTNGLMAKEGTPISIVNYPSEWSRLNITDNTGNNSVLYFGKNITNINSYELPPIPPADIFDVRFASDMNVGLIDNTSKEIKINGGVYPIILRGEGISLSLKDKATGGKLLNRLLRDGEAIELSNSAITDIMVSVEVIPMQYELLQNYPNPFNPSTTIKFGLPVKSNVTLSIYNSLGEKVEDLVSGEKEAGYHTIEWNAEKYSSGIYIYELKTPGQRFVKKLMMVK